MKKNIILFSIFILALTIIPINIKALTGNDGNEYPSKPDDEYNNYFIYYTDNTCTDCSTNTEKGTYLFSYIDDNAFLTSSYWFSSNRIDVNVYQLPPYNGGPSIVEPNSNISYKRYKLVNDNWVLHLSGDNTYRKSERVYKMIYSTKDIYYRYDAAQSTYPSGNGFIPGTYKVTIPGLEGAYQFKTYNADVQMPIITYDYNLEINPNIYNYVYLKFKGVGDLKTYIKHNLTNPQGLFYHLYKNKEEIYIPYIENNADAYFEQFFVNSLDNDVFTLILPLYKYKKLFKENDIYNLYFTVPGLIEYGTNDYQYNIIHNNDGTTTTEKVDHDREEIEDFLTPGDNEHTEITSIPSSTNSLTNSSLNEFMWPYSLFARNGTNIKNVSLVGKYNSTSNISSNDFNSSLNINYGSENYGISINNCIFKEQCYLTNYEQTLIKNILFDRNVENSDYYLQFLIKPLKNISLSDSDQFNFGISLEFNSSVELTINSMLLAINNLSNSYYNVYFKLYDSSNKIHTIYKTSLAANYVGVNQFKLEERTSDIYRVDLMFVYNHTATSISANDKYVLDFSEFNIFANTNLIHIYTDNTNITYQTCEWFNIFCHIQNGFTWLLYEAPILKDFWVICLKLVNIFNIIWTLITYIFLPFDIIPPLLGVSMSTLMPFILIVLFIIKKMWFGGGD